MKEQQLAKVKEMVGKKVSVYIGGKMIERVLRYDNANDEFYVKYKNEEFPVRPEEGKEYLVVAAQTAADNSQPETPTVEADKQGVEEPSDYPKQTATILPFPAVSNVGYQRLIRNMRKGKMLQLAESPPRGVPP